MTMASMELNATYGAPFSRKTTGANPETEIAKLMKRFPKSSIEKIAEKYAAICEDDLDLCRANAFWVVPLAVRNIQRRTQAVQTETNGDRQKINRAEIAAVKQSAASAVKQTRRGFAVNFIMTHKFGELVQIHAANNGIRKIMKMGRPDQYVRDVLSEATVLRMLSK